MTFILYHLYSSAPQVYGYEFIDRVGNSEADFVGIFYGGNGTQLGFQLLAVIIMTIYGAGASAILFCALALALTLILTGGRRCRSRDEAIVILALIHILVLILSQSG